MTTEVRATVTDVPKDHFAPLRQAFFSMGDPSGEDICGVDSTSGLGGSVIVLWYVNPRTNEREYSTVDTREILANFLETKRMPNDLIKVLR